VALRRRPRLPRHLVPALWLATAGCSVLGLRLEQGEERVAVRQVDLKFRGQDQGELLLGLLVHSPGDAPAEATGLSWELWLEDRWFASGTQTVRDLAPAVARELSFSLPLAFRTLRTTEGLSPLRVRVRGEVTVRWSGLERRLAFDHRRVLEVSGAPQLRGRKLE
jgi:hypothetical protein